MSYRLKGKVAFITGAGRGFGRAIAAAFSEAGADLALSYRTSESGCEEVAAERRAAGGRAATYELDITDSQAVERVVGEAVSDVGTIDILVNNAGVLKLRPFLESEEHDWHEELRTNILGPMYVSRAVLPDMVGSGYGRVINVASHVALGGWGRAPVYAGTKGFMLSWTKSLAKELGPHGITVNAIGPGGIVTDMSAGVFPSDDARRKRADASPLRRLGSPEDVAETALFLASESANYITGQMINPNGGSTM